MKKEWWLKWRSSGRGHKRGKQIIKELCRWQNCGPQFLTILSMYKNFKCNKKKDTMCVLNMATLYEMLNGVAFVGSRWQQERLMVVCS